MRTAAGSVMVLALTFVVVLASYIAGIYAGLRISRRISFTGAHDAPEWAITVVNLSIRAFVFLVVLIVVTTAVFPVLLLLRSLD